MRLPIRLSPLLLPAVLVCVLRMSPAPAQAVGPELRVNTYTTDKQATPRIATDAAGNFVVVWASTTQDGSAVGVFGQRYCSSGAPLGTEFRVNTYTTSSQYSPSVASDSGGNFVVVWRSYPQDGSATGVFGQRYGSSGAPLGTEFLVNTYTTNNQIFPSVASDSGGNFVVVWFTFSQDGSGFGVFGKRYGIAGAPLGAEFQVNTYTTNFQTYPSVARDSAGNFVVVWQSFAQDGSYSGVFGQRYGSTGAPLGAEFRVNAYVTSNQDSPSVASGSGGSFVVVWRSYTQDGSGGFGVWCQRYSSTGAPLGGEFRVNTYTTEYKRFPSVAAGSSGDFVVVWQSNTQDGSIFGIFGQRYSSAGAPLGAEFRVSSFTPFNQQSASVASGPGGSFVVVWQSYLQDGLGYGVFGQRFCFGLPTVTPPPAITTTQTLCM